KHSDLLVELCGEIIFDTGFCSATRKIILKNHLYHIDGIFNSFKNNISESIQEIYSQKPKRPWVNSALDALLYTMTTFSLQKYGKPLWHKTEVMNFVQTNLPAQFDFVSNLYNLKSSNKGREEAKNYSIESKTEILIKLEKLQSFVFSNLVQSPNGELESKWIKNNNKHYSKLIHNIMDYL
ncbi:MAG: hypothetical protein KAH30_04125, partial [Caldisericia bacterium]|nr:hypothetical protein [Caldisericia bacterium]